ncbi:MAG: segregation ATPase FtsK/SpoIIIE, family, partial [Acidimicrobiia bacterium]|nr:segregation ATPase FtsK/SpoIIIE, family [Acidimicrobiia bacterium]
AVQAAAALHIPPPRTPWPPALPSALLLADLDAYAQPLDPSREAADLVKLFVVDDPDRQRQYVGGWHRTDGNLLIVGPVGSGTTTALATAAVSLTKDLSPGRVQLYVVDGAGGALEPLGDLPHCGGVVRLGDDERLVRLIHRLRDELDLRRSLDPQARGDRPDVVLLIDGWSALQAELERPGHLTLGEELARVIREGPEVGLRAVIAADRSGAVRPRIDATMTQRLVLGWEDGPAAARSGRVPGGLGAGIRERPPGRGVEAGAGLAIQVALPGEGVDLADAVGVNVRRWSAHAALGPRSLGRLPARLDIHELLIGVSPAGGEPWRLPIGLRSSDLAPTGWTIHGGDHVLITGPARSGRSMTLRAVAVALRHCRPDLALVAVTPRRSPLGCEELAGRLAPDELGALAGWVERGPTAILVDDAETVEDPSGLLTQWIEARRPDVLVVAAARNDAVRSQYGSWLRRLRPSRLGLLLQPDAEADGDVMGVRLPRRPPAALSAGRGYLVDGSRVEYVQTAAVDPANPTLHLSD